MGFDSRKCIWKCRLQNVVYFVWGSMCWNSIFMLFGTDYPDICENNPKNDGKNIKWIHSKLYCHNKIKHMVNMRIFGGIYISLTRSYLNIVLIIDDGLARVTLTKRLVLAFFLCVIFTILSSSVLSLHATDGDMLPLSLWKIPPKKGSTIKLENYSTPGYALLHKYCYYTTRNLMNIYLCIVYHLYHRHIMSLEWTDVRL